METNRLKQFCAIIETGSLVKASRLLHITHSALSKSMKILQEEINLSLFRPSGRGIAPTDEGVQIYHRAREFLEYESRLFKLENNIKSTQIKIGTVEIFLFCMSEKLGLSTLKNNYFTFLDLDPGNMEQLIANHQIDYGITYAPFPLENIEIMEIGTYRLGCYHLKNTFIGQNISNIPFVVPSQSLANNPLDIKERDGWIESLYPRHKKYSVNLLSTAIELTLQGLCAIYIPDFVAKKINSHRKTSNILVEYPLPKKQKKPHRAFLLRHKDKKDDIVFKELFKIMKETITSI